MKFQKCEGIVLLGRDKKPMPNTVSGYRWGCFTIHKCEIQPTRPWVLSVNGIQLLRCWYLENAKHAAKEFAQVPVNWNAPANEITKEVLHSVALQKQLGAVRDKYQSTGKVAV